MQVIVTADDFGMHSCVNLGVIEAHCHGVVTATSLVVNFEGSAEAARLAVETPSLRVGLHLNLSSGRCIAPKEKIPALVDGEGRFRFESNDVSGSMGRLRKAIAEDRRILYQVEREFWAQVERLQQWHLTPSHLDIHHYLALIHIDLFEKYVELANQLAVPFRGLCYPMIEMLRVPRSIVAEMEDIICRTESPAPQMSLGNLVGSKPAVLPSPAEYQRSMELKLRSLFLAGAQNVELITHPAMITDLVRRYDTYVWARELETALVNSRSFARFLERNDFHLVSHGDLGHVRHHG